MNPIINAVAPRNKADLLFKACVLVGLFTAFDFITKKFIGPYTEDNLALNLIVTFVIGAPFGLFVMWVMGRQRQLHQELGLRADTDHLTGLWNRQAFLREARKMLATGQNHAALMIDVDYFKSINDTHGHQAGDACLQLFSDHLRRNIRQGDIAGRIGGEEFAVLLCNTDSAIATRIANRICQAIKLHPVIDNEARPDAFHFTVSVGCASLLDGETLTNLLHSADKALYQAKNTGRAKVAFWPGQLNETHVSSPPVVTEDA